MDNNILNQLKARNFNFITQDDKIFIKTLEGDLIIEYISNAPKVIKKNNLNNYGTIGGFLFFIVIVIVDRNEGESNNLYILFVILFAIYYLHNHVILEINKHKIYDILSQIK